MPRRHLLGLAALAIGCGGGPRSMPISPPIPAPEATHEATPEALPSASAAPAAPAAPPGSAPAAPASVAAPSSSSAPVAEKAFSTFRATLAPETTKVAGHAGVDVSLGFPDGFVHYVGWWESEGRPCRAAVGGIKAERGKWELLWQEVELGKCPRTDAGLRSIAFDPPVTMKWQGRFVAPEDRPTVLRSLAIMTTTVDANPKDEVVKGFVAKGVRVSGSVLLPRDDEAAEKRPGGKALYTDGSCGEGKAIRKVILQKGTSGLGKDAIVGLRVECAKAEIR